MSSLLVVMCVAVTLLVVSVGLAVWWTTRLLRRVCRSVKRFVDQSALSVQAHLVPAAARPVAGTRLQLRAEIDRTRRVLEDAARRHCPLGDLPTLFRRIEHHAGSADAELALLARDRDPVQRAHLDAVLHRSQDLVSMAATIRRTVSGVSADMDMDGFALLQRDLDLEVSALRAGAATVRQP